MAFLIKLLLIVLQRVDPNILLTFCMNKGSDFIYDPVFALFEKKIFCPLEKLKTLSNFAKSELKMRI